MPEAMIAVGNSLNGGARSKSWEEFRALNVARSQSCEELGVRRDLLNRAGDKD